MLNVDVFSSKTHPTASQFSIFYYPRRRSRKYCFQLSASVWKLAHFFQIWLQIAIQLSWTRAYTTHLVEVCLCLCVCPHHNWETIADTCICFLLGISYVYWRKLRDEFACQGHCRSKSRLFFSEGSRSLGRLRARGSDRDYITVVASFSYLKFYKCSRIENVLKISENLNVLYCLAEGCRPKRHFASATKQYQLVPVEKWEGNSSLWIMPTIMEVHTTPRLFQEEIRTL